MQRKVKHKIKGIKDDKQKTKIDLMERAHDILITYLQQGAGEFGLFSQLNEGDNSAPVIAEKEFRKAVMLARTRVIDHFFQICNINKPLELVVDEEILKTLLPLDMQRTKAVYTSEYLRLALEIRRIINQQE